MNAYTDDNAPAWHAISADEVVKLLATSGEKGLDAAEASKRLQEYGPNRLPEGRKRGPMLRFLAQFNNILVYVLLAAGFIKLMLNLWVDAGIIFAVVILNALLGFVQEGKAEKALDSIRNMLSTEARVVRGGETRMIIADQLVPGDVVLLESGDTGHHAGERLARRAPGLAVVELRDRFGALAQSAGDAVQCGPAVRDGGGLPAGQRVAGDVHGIRHVLLGRDRDGGQR